MTTEELALATCDELIKELLSRPTFVGMVLHSTTEHREDGQSHKDFVLETSLESDDSLRLLEQVVGKMQKG